MPTTEMSQAYFLQDYLLQAMSKDKDLNKNLRLIGPSSSSKTIILNTFSNKMTVAVNKVIVPMTSYLTLEVLKAKIESNYTAKRKNTLIPKDSNKRTLLVIDDVHLQRNLKVEVLEFLRSWCICRGYFDVPDGFFKRIGEFGSIMAENSDFQSTATK